MERVLRRMEALGPVSSEQQQRLEGLARGIEAVPAKTVLQTEGSPSRRPCFVVSGWACRLRFLSDGRRQILSLVLPGDPVGLAPRPDPLAGATTMALTRLDIAPAESLLSPSGAACPELTEALARAAREEQQRILGHVVRLGRLTAYERTAHFICELHERLAQVGLVREGRFPFPLTQDVLADTLGLSVVHVNRTLQSLRRAGLLKLERGYAALPDLTAIGDIADYGDRPARRPVRSFEAGALAGP
jgi:CRP-like cAMP-binding protein